MAKARDPYARFDRPGALGPFPALIDLLERRSALRVILALRKGPLTFLEIQDAAGGPSPNVLAERLKQLRGGWLVERFDQGGGYGLTRRGEELAAQLLPLEKWATRWAEGP